MDEKELIQQVLAGNEEAKTRFYTMHAHRLKPICVHFLGYQDPDIEDIIQQTFLIGLQKLQDFEPRSTLYTWLAHICVNLCYERIRKRKRVLASLQEELEQLTTSLVQTRERERNRESEQQEKIKWMEGLIHSMGEKCRGILLLRDFQGQSYAAIGKAMKIPIGTVMSQLARCRETLKRLAENSLEEGR